jgi:hypothetical protein
MSGVRPRLRRSQRQSLGLRAPPVAVLAQIIKLAVAIIELPPQ